MRLIPIFTLRKLDTELAPRAAGATIACAQIPGNAARLPSANNIFALIASRFLPLGQRRKWRIGRLGFHALLEDRTGLAGIGIEAEGEELRRKRAEVDLPVDHGIGLVLILKRRRPRFPWLWRPGIRRRPRREAHVDCLIHRRLKRLERNDAGLRALAVDGAGDASPAAALRLEPERRRQDGDGRKPKERRERLPLGGGGFDGHALVLPRKGVDPRHAGERPGFGHDGSPAAIEPGGKRKRPLAKASIGIWRRAASSKATCEASASACRPASWPAAPYTLRLSAPARRSAAPSSSAAP